MRLSWCLRQSGPQLVQFDLAHFSTTDACAEDSKIVCLGELAYIADFLADMSLGDPVLDNEIEQSVSGQETLTAGLEAKLDRARLGEIEIVSVDHFEGINPWIGFEA